MLSFVYYKAKKYSLKKKPLDMNLTIVTSSLSHGGSERTAVEMANHFIKRKHKVSIITSKLSLKTPFYKLSKGIEIIGLEELQIRENSIIKKFFLFFRRSSALRQVIKSIDTDIVISFIETLNVTTLMSSFGLNKPVIVVEQSDPYHHKIPKFYGFLRLILYPLSSSVVVINKSAMIFFERRFLRNCVVIPNPNRITSIKRKRIRRNPNSIVTVGRLINAKDQQTLIRAIPAVLKNFSELSLYIYGEGELRDELQNLIKNLKIRNNVFLMGAKQNVEKYIQKGDLFVFPSIYEGCPLALLEAMALGVPCLVSDCDGNTEIIENKINGEVFQTGEVNELSNKITNILTSYCKRQRYSKAGQADVMKYNADIIFKKWEKLFIKLIKTKLRN